MQTTQQPDYTLVEGIVAGLVVLVGILAWWFLVLPALSPLG